MTATNPIKLEKTILSSAEIQKAIKHHKNAAKHYEEAAKHHHEAVKHHEAGNHEKAYECTIKAHWHHSFAGSSQRELLRNHVWIN